jgi:hypothetical protein
MNSGIYMQGGIRTMKVCFSYFGKVSLPDKPASDSRHSQDKKKSNHSWLIGSSSSIPKEMSTNLSEHKDKAEIFYGKNTKHDIQWEIGLEVVSPHSQSQKVEKLVGDVDSKPKESQEQSPLKESEYDIPQWQIELKDVSPHPESQEMEELVDNVNSKLKEFRENLKTSNFPSKTIECIMKTFSSDTESLKAHRQKQRKLTDIQKKIEIVSHVISEWKEIQQLLESEKKPTLNSWVNDCIDELTQNHPMLTWQKRSFEDIDTIKELLKAYRDKQQHSKKSSQTKKFSTVTVNCEEVLICAQICSLFEHIHRIMQHNQKSSERPQKHQEPHFLNDWLEQVAPSDQQSDELTELPQTRRMSRLVLCRVWTFLEQYCLINY